MSSCSSTSARLPDLRPGRNASSRTSGRYGKSASLQTEEKRVAEQNLAPHIDRHDALHPLHACVRFGRSSPASWNWA